MKKLLFKFVLAFIPLVAIGKLPRASFHHIERDVQILSSGYVCLAQDDYGFIWFGSFHGGGLYRFDGYEIKSFVIDPDNLEESLASNRINSVVAPGDDLLYISTHGGWNTLNLQTGQFRAFANRHDLTPDEGAFYITRVMKDPSSRLWITSSYGLSMQEPKTDDIHWLRPNGRPGTKSPHRFRDIILDRSDPNILWLAAFDGLVQYSIKDNSYTFLTDGPTDLSTLSQDTFGTIWVSSYNSASFSGYQPNEDLWHHYSTGEILGDSFSAGGVEVLADNQIWITTSNHVGIFNPETRMFDGWQLDSNNREGLLWQGNYYDVMNDRHGRLWIGSWYGIQYAKQAFVTPQLSRNPVSVNIIDFNSSNERVDRARPLIYTNEIDLLKDQRDFQIKYVLPNPMDLSSVEYQYKLEGYDKDWITTKSREVRYSKVAGGNYTFQIRGREGTDFYTAITSLGITIEKKLIEYWWFWVVSLGFIAEIIAIGVWARVAAVRKQEKLKMQFKHDLAEVQMKALRSQMNPHFLFNCLNSIKYYALEKDKDATADYLGKFSLLVRRILNNSKSDTIYLKDELDAIRLYIEIENLRLEDKFDYSIEVDPQVFKSNVKIPPMILQPYIENSIWHGLMPKQGRGHLLVRVKDLGKRIQCIIEDDGQGRRNAREMAAQQPTYRKSMGMQITKDRLRLIEEIHNLAIELDIVDLVDSEGEPCGTRVVIEIPYLD